MSNSGELHLSVVNMPKAKTRTMSVEHKAALAEGRKAGAAVRAYVQALEDHAPRRGRRRTPDSIEKRLTAIDEQIPEADPLKRVSLIQKRMDLQDELARLTEASSIEEFEAGFVEYASSYSERKGISYAAWRELGVPAAVLKQAGISRAS